MVDNIGDSWLSKNELIARAESFQFEKGGYHKIVSAEMDSTRSN